MPQNDIGNYVCACILLKHPLSRAWVVNFGLEVAPGSTDVI